MGLAGNGCAGGIPLSPVVLDAELYPRLGDEEELTGSGERMIVGVFVFTLIDAKEKRIQRRFKELAYLNHHIRNALTIIEGGKAHRDG